MIDDVTRNIEKTRAAAERMRRSRERQKSGQIVLPTITLNAAGIDQLINRGFLAAEARASPTAVGEAFLAAAARALWGKL